MTKEIKSDPAFAGSSSPSLPLSLPPLTAPKKRMRRGLSPPPPRRAKTSHAALAATDASYSARVRSAPSAAGRDIRPERLPCLSLGLAALCGLQARGGQPLPAPSPYLQAEGIGIIHHVSLFCQVAHMAARRQLRRNAGILAAIGASGGEKDFSRKCLTNSGGVW